MSCQRLSSASEPQSKRPRDQPMPMRRTRSIVGRNTLPLQIIFSLVRQVLPGKHPICYTLALTTMCVLRLSHRYQFRPLLKKIPPLNMSLQLGIISVCAAGQLFCADPSSILYQWSPTCIQCLGHVHSKLCGDIIQEIETANKFCLHLPHLSDHAKDCLCLADRSSHWFVSAALKNWRSFLLEYKNLSINLTSKLDSNPIHSNPTLSRNNHYLLTWLPISIGRILKCLLQNPTKAQAERMRNSRSLFASSLMEQHWSKQTSLLMFFAKLVPSSTSLDPEAKARKPWRMYWYHSVLGRRLKL